MDQNIYYSDIVSLSVSACCYKNSEETALILNHTFVHVRSVFRTFNHCCHNYLGRREQ